MESHAQTPLMPLDELREFMSYNPYHWWGFSTPDSLARFQSPQFNQNPTKNNCNILLSEYSYQYAQNTSRATIRDAIYRAEKKLGDYLGFDVAPRFHEEVQPYPRLADHLTRIRPIASDGRTVALQLSHGKIQQIGVEQLDLIEANVALTRVNAIKPNDRFSLTVAVPVDTDPNEIAVYFSATERNGAVSERWRIEPVTISVTGGAATITGGLWLIGRPELYETFTLPQNGIDPSNLANFAATLDIYRRWCNPSGTTLETAGAVLAWETRPYPAWCYAPAGLPYSRDPAAVGLAVGRSGIRDAENALVTPADAIYDATADPPQWHFQAFHGWREPDHVRIRTLAGVPLQGGRMDRFWRDLVCILAIAELAGPICSCRELDPMYSYWQADIAQTSGSVTYQAASPESLRNPFGTRRGAIEAWQKVRDFRRFSAFSM